MTILDVENIEWHSVEDSLPDADTTVLVYCPTDDAQPVWLGSYSDGMWIDIVGDLYELDTVTAWAAMPKGPST